MLLRKICDFDAERDTVFAHQAEGFGRVMHVFNDAWHGIRAASGYAPGHKLAISEKEGLDGEALRHALGLINRRRIDRVVFQGFSRTAADLAIAIRNMMGSEVMITAVTHVTATQFENFFEIEMQGVLLSLMEGGVIDRLGSVKPRFSEVIPAYWPKTIINYGPNLTDVEATFNREAGALFVPIENTWRKNLYTNMIAALPVEDVKKIYTVNFPTALEQIADTQKISVVPYSKGTALFSLMASVELMLNVTLAECQPMTQLEPLAVGTPCLTGPLRMEEFADDPLFKLCEVQELDCPTGIRARIHEVLHIQRTDPGAMLAMIDAHMTRRTALATQSYEEFLEI